MFRLAAILLIGTTVQGLSDVNRRCLADNQAPLPNDQLKGTWFEVYRFSLFGNLPASQQCTSNTFTAPTAEDLEKYRSHYDTTGLPYSFDDNPVHVARTFNGMVMGDTEAKFYVLEPAPSPVIHEGYEVNVYKPLNDKFLLFTPCSLRGNSRTLWSRDRNATVEEMSEIIRNTPELVRMASQRFCA